MKAKIRSVNQSHVSLRKVRSLKRRGQGSGVRRRLKFADTYEFIIINSMTLQAIIVRDLDIHSQKTTERNTSR